MNLTTDVIVGFPTEDDAAFQRTLEAVDAAGITRVHTFSYSPRPGTEAQTLGDRVAPEEKKRRSRELRGHSEVRSRHHRASKLGTRERVLIDKVAPTQCSGYTADYTRCYLPAGAGARGQIVAVECAELQADGIACRLRARRKYCGLVRPPRALDRHPLARRASARLRSRAAPSIHGSTVQTPH